MLPNREGYFHAIPEVTVDQTGPNQLWTAMIKYRIYAEVTDTGEVDVRAEGMEITGYHYLTKKDGSLNDFTLDALKRALGWDGANAEWLVQQDFSEHPVTIKLGFETFNNVQRIKVQFLNPHGETGSGEFQKDPAKAAAFQRAFGSKLRALNGGAQRPAPKPTSRPVPPKPAAPAPGCTDSDAWAAFLALRAKDPKCYTEDYLQNEWGRIWTELQLPEPDAMTPQDWATLRDKGPAMVVPF